MTGNFCVLVLLHWLELIPNQESAQKIECEEENSPAAPTGNQTGDLPITSLAHYYSSYIPAVCVSKQQQQQQHQQQRRAAAAAEEVGREAGRCIDV